MLIRLVVMTDQLDNLPYRTYHVKFSKSINEQGFTFLNRYAYVPVTRYFAESVRGGDHVSWGGSEWGRGVGWEGRGGGRRVVG